MSLCIEKVAAHCRQSKQSRRSETKRCEPNGSSKGFRIQCFVCSIAYCDSLRCRLVVCVLNYLNHPERAMADCIWMENALIASCLAERRDMACSWVRKQGAIERDLSNETAYQELVEELRRGAFSSLLT